MSGTRPFTQAADGGLARRIRDRRIENRARCGNAAGESRARRARELPRAVPQRALDRERLTV